VAVVKMIRRAIVAVVIGGLTALILRLRGKGGTPPQRGGWRPLELPPR
jgi:hypothetical protein